MPTARKPPAATRKPPIAAFPSRAELYESGKRLRDKYPREAHGTWKAGRRRPNQIDLLKRSSEGRQPHLVPLRYGRMLQTPFTFFRGAALNMAADLSFTPSIGLRVQACGDCHLYNFGAFRTPERRVVFDLNDMDETLPAPWEWDVKRLAASFVLAGRNNGFGSRDARDAARTCVRSYREHMLKFSQMRVLDVWNTSADLNSILAAARDIETRRRGQRRLAKARQRNVIEHDFPELVSVDGATPTIKDNPPSIFHPTQWKGEDFAAMFAKGFADYRKSLPENRRLLLDRYRLLDLAVKVVGVGSVGTACGVMLLMAGEKDPLFLQIKEARPSVLEAYAGKTTYANNGERIVVGCQLMQSASDLFLGWTSGRNGKEFYIRQLRDMKIKPLVEVFTASVMLEFAELCGMTLARAHARTGEPATISGYLGKSAVFDRAVAEFAVEYADQVERDHAALIKAVRAGTLEVELEEHG